MYRLNYEYHNTQKLAKLQVARIIELSIYDFNNKEQFIKRKRSF